MGESLAIATLASPDTGNGFYRGIAPMMALELRGHRIVTLPWGRPFAAAALDGIDLVHVHRDTSESTLRLVQAARQRGAAVVWDNDDDMGAIPRGTVSYQKLGGARWERRRIEMRGSSPSRPRVRPECPPGDGSPTTAPRATAVIENYPPDQFLRVPARSHRGVVVGWIAGKEHSYDADQLGLHATVDRLLADLPELEVHTFGARLGRHPERRVHTPVVPLLELTEAATAFDLGIAPIADCGMNRARSNIKLKEYAAAGLPWLASPIGPYAELGERQGGRLVADDRWYEEIRRLVEHARERRKLAKRARKWVEGETLERNVQRWEVLFSETVERKRAINAAQNR